jgi:hypothetical protein
MEEEMKKAAKGQAMDLRRVHLAGRAAFPERVSAARIPIEHYRGALLVAGSGKDAVWPSSEMARNIFNTRAKFGLRTTLLIYPGAGHGISGPGTDPVAALTALGGGAVAIAHARAATWAATSSFFAGAFGVSAGHTDLHLRRRPPPGR